MPHRSRRTVVIEARTFIRFEVQADGDGEPLDVDDVARQYEDAMTRRASWQVVCDDDHGKWVGTITAFDVAVDKAYRLTE
jgi:hypothetical protein